MVAVKSNVIVPRANPWYRKHFDEVANGRKNFIDWRVVDGQLYYCRPNYIDYIGFGRRSGQVEVGFTIRYEEALREAHDTPQSGHLGVDKMFHKLAVAYYWPNMFRDVAKYMKRCDVCQHTKIEQASSAGLMGRRIVEGSWTVVAADIMKLFPKSKSGIAYILVVQNLFTKWVECFALRAANNKKIGEALGEVVSRWEIPRFLLTDNGTEFINQTLRAFAAEHRTTHTTVPLYPSSSQSC